MAPVVPLLRTEQFQCSTWAGSSVPNAIILSVEASDLGPQGSFVSDVDLLSQRTGTLVRFCVSKIHRDRDGDLTHWELEPANVELAGKIKLVIWND